MSTSMRHVLSARLEAIAACVPPGRAAADIGTDHAALAVALIERNVVEFVIATDIHERPWLAARANARHLGTRVELRLGDGLAVLRPHEVETLIIAGMGGSRICEILERGDAVVAASRRIILQPQTEWPKVRRFIADRGWPVLVERLVVERKHHYLVLALAPRANPPHPWNELDLELGPTLRHHPTEVYETWLRAELRRCQHALARARGSARAEDPRFSQLARRVALLEDALAHIAFARA